jgi:hypothetical protein
MIRSSCRGERDERINIVMPRRHGFAGKHATLPGDNDSRGLTSRKSPISRCMLRVVH